MNEISCEICIDLLPLVLDGAASGESREAVLRHIQNCPACRSLWEGERVPQSEEEQVLPKLVKKVQAISTVFLGIFLLLGIGICEWIMRGSSVFFLGAMWAARRLLKAAAAKNKGLPRRLLALLAAAGILAATGWMSNTLLGNPVDRARAKQAAQAYLEAEYSELGLEAGEVSYSSSSGTYDVEVIARADTEFTVVYRRGEILYDTYGEE